jgi:hypothetical protein
VYTGSLDARGLRTGRGLLRFAGGGSYDGEFENNVPHGQGRLVEADVSGKRWGDL